MRGICVVFCLMIIYAVDVCDAEYDEYVVVFKEITCPTYVQLIALKRPHINWNKVTHPCNSTDKNTGKKKCVVEFDCVGTQRGCQPHRKIVSHQTHSFVDEHTVKLITSTTKTPFEPKLINNITVEDIPKGITNITLEDVPKDITNFTLEDEPKHITNITVGKKPHHTVDDEFNNTSTYDVNLLYINDNVKQNRSKTTYENCTLYCDYAEIVCTDGEGRPDNYSSSDIKKVNTLQIAINRDETSSVQPLFTGYFPESSDDSATNYKIFFKNFKTVSLSCSTLKYINCKQNIENESTKQINVYIKANYVENNTITQYPACTNNSITAKNILNLKCEDILFAKHNPYIAQTPPTSPPKQELSIWHCQITELNKLSSKEQRNRNRKINFINCTSEVKIVNNVLTKNGTDMNKTEIATEKKEININPSSQTNPENMITIIITENPNNCSDNLYFNINEGKIIDLGINNNEKILQTNNVELILPNCMNDISSTFNEMQPHPKVELSIILTNESLITLNLKHFNGTPKDLSVKQRILLRCNNSNLDLSRNRTVLQCESINLDLYNITGIEIAPVSEKSSNKTAITSNSKTKQQFLNWNCQIIELNDKLSSKEQRSENSKLYFKNCAYEFNINNSKSKTESSNVTPTSDGMNRTVVSTKYTIERNKTEMPSGTLELNKDNLSNTNPENIIKIIVMEKEFNCSNNFPLNIAEGKIIDLHANNKNTKILKNNSIKVELMNCINVNSSINNETQPDSKVELTIILKNESLNDLDQKQFNGTAKMGNVKQRILLRCDHPNLDYNNTELQCEAIDLDSYNITGIEISTNISPTPNAKNTKEKKKDILKTVNVNHNQTKVNEEENANNNFTEKTVENNENTVNNKSYENHDKEEENKKVQKKNSGNDYSTTLNFNRKKDIPNGAGQNSLALGNPETEKILLIALLTVASVAILIVIALRACPKREYNLAPTREPPDEEETAF